MSQSNIKKKNRNNSSKLGFKEDVFSLFRNKYFWIGLLVLVTGILTNFISSTFLHRRYGGTLPVLNDLLLDNLPVVHAAWLYDLFSIISILLIVYYSLTKQTKNIPFILLVYGISNILRGTFISLTPLGDPNGSIVGIFVDRMSTAGLYPSGHTANAFLAFLLSKGIYRKIFLILAIAIIVTLLISRGHYSIDIFSAIIFSYAIYKFSEEKFKNFRADK